MAIKIINDIGSELIYNTVKKEVELYCSGKCFSSVTGLLRPPELVVLTERCNEGEFDIEVPVSNYLNRFLGSMFDKAIAEANNIERKRISFPFGLDKEIISGEFDAYIDNALIDFKLFSCSWFVGGGVHELEKQLNIYYCLLVLNGLVEDTEECVLQGHIMLKDAYDKKMLGMGITSKGKVVEVEKWPLERTISFITGKINDIKEMSKKSTQELLEIAKMNYQYEELTGYKVIGEGNKTARKVVKCSEYGWNCEKAEVAAKELAKEYNKKGNKQYSVSPVITSRENFLYSDFKSILK